jgi:hypothetical protein
MIKMSNSVKIGKGGTTANALLSKEIHGYQDQHFKAASQKRKMMTGAE